MEQLMSVDCSKDKLFAMFYKGEEGKMWELTLPQARGIALALTSARSLNMGSEVIPAWGLTICPMWQYIKMSNAKLPAYLSNVEEGKKWLEKNYPDGRPLSQTNVQPLNLLSGS